MCWDGRGSLGTHTAQGRTRPSFQAEPGHRGLLPHGQLGTRPGCMTLPSSLPGSGWFTNPPVPRRGQRKHSRRNMSCEANKRMQKSARKQSEPRPTKLPLSSTFSLHLSWSNLKSEFVFNFIGFWSCFTISSLLLAFSFLLVP